jgi:hypothetical protein
VNIKLRNAVLKQVSTDREYAEQVAKDAARNGADAGWPGFTMTVDCVKFAKKYRKDIVADLLDMSDSCGENLIGMMRNWKYLKDVPELSIAAAITGGTWDKEEDEFVLEQMAWYALEEAGNALD